MIHLNLSMAHGQRMVHVRATRQPTNVSLATVWKMEKVRCCHTVRQMGSGVSGQQSVSVSTYSLIFPHFKACAVFHIIYKL